MANNSNLKDAKKAKNDEFYTQISDIEKELKHYKEHFKNKVVFCNCDDPSWSNFWRYFHLNFEYLGLKKLVSTHFDLIGTSYKMEYEGGNDNDFEVGTKTPLKYNGDFRSFECKEILKECDIVVTNPPFSLFREYVAQLIDFDKKFLILGNMNAITYKEIFPLIKKNKVWTGFKNFSGGMDMIYAKRNISEDFNKKNYKLLSNGDILINIAGVIWFTNLEHNKRHESLGLIEKYSPEKYPKYDNYDAINVNKVLDIPVDYDGVMGVPITFIDKWNPDQFDILGMASSAHYDKNIVGLDFNGEKDGRPLINNKNTYARIFIQRKH